MWESGTWWRAKHGSTGPWWTSGYIGISTQAFWTDHNITSYNAIYNSWLGGWGGWWPSGPSWSTPWISGDGGCLLWHHGSGTWEAAWVQHYVELGTCYDVYPPLDFDYYSWGTSPSGSPYPTVELGHW